MAASSWHSRRAFSLEAPGRERNQSCTQSSDKEELHNRGPVQDDGSPSKYAVLQHVRNGGSIFTFEHEYTNLDCTNNLSEVTPVAKLKKFVNNVIEKLFDDKESERTNGVTQEKARANLVSMDTNTDFSAKLSTLMSYFSSENRDKYFKGEFLSLLAKKLFSGKDGLHLNEFTQRSDDCKETGNELAPGETVDHSPGMTPSSDVIICMNEKTGDSHQIGGRAERGSISLNVVARLVESLASSSDADSDSSSSSDYPASDSSAAEDCDRVRTLVARGNKTFHHTTVNFHDRLENFLAESMAAEDSLSSSSSSSVFSTGSSSISSSSSSTRTQKKSKSKLFQRYYHVFCAGELGKLVQDGIPSAVLLKEYHDHGNWAAILEKTQASSDFAKSLKKTFN